MATDTDDLQPLDDQSLIDFCKLFECQVDRTPNQVAVIFEDDAFTYEQLNAAANQIAHFLLRLAPKREQCVGICLDRSFDAIAAMLGIFKAGCAFVPLDPEFPVDRLEFIVQDAGIEQIICDSNYRNLFEKKQSNTTLLDLQALLKAELQSTNPLQTVAPEDLAYIMYTSGSTGQPKGVQIEHRSLAAYCFADIELYQVVESDRTLQFSTLNFDIAIEEIFPPLLTGSSVVVRPRERATAHNELSSIVERYGVTAIHLATAYWHEWVDLMLASKTKVPSTIRLMVVTGEKVSTEHFRRWKSICDHSVLWCNAYGPTEATVSATVFIPDETWDGDNMPIGKPLKRYDTVIVDGSNQPIKKDETGELLIGGPALARGYLNRPDLNDKAFVTLSINGSNPQRYYRTGDLSRWLPNGDIEFAGRIDHQIKLGSYRIEPGEIEAAVNQHTQVRESLITYEEIESKKYLIAYVAQGNASIELNELTDFLRDRLPTYMIPTRFVLIESFPKTINGKIDRRNLPAPSTSQVARHTDFAAASNEMEEQLATIWADVLNLPEVGIHDDFFTLGGSSLLVTRVITQISSQLDIEIPVRDFFANPTIASIARHLSRLVHPEDELDDGHELSRALRAKLPTVHPFFFKNGNYELFGIHYNPVPTSNDSAEPNPAVLICPAYGHEYARAHRNLQQLACQLAQNGCHVLRFDYAATGNSSGTCEEANVDQWLQDVRAAAAKLMERAQTSHISIVGIRLGATLAATVATEMEELENVILWDPISRGDSFCHLLDKFHDESLVGFGRFQRTRKRSNVDQAYGFQMTKTKRAGMQDLQLGSLEPLAPTYLIASKDYMETESIEFPHTHWQLRQTDDELSWHSAEHTESAFSSPAAYKTILNIVTGEAS